MRETQTAKMNIIPFLLFYIEKLYFVRVFFFAWKIIGNTVIKRQRPYTYALVL